MRCRIYRNLLTVKQRPEWGLHALPIQIWLISLMSKPFKAKRTYIRSRLQPWMPFALTCVLCRQSHTVPLLFGTPLLPSCVIIPFFLAVLRGSLSSSVVVCCSFAFNPSSPTPRSPPMSSCQFTHRPRMYECASACVRMCARWVCST